MPLCDVAIAITSLWRHGYLLACLDGIAKNLPEVSVIVADDSDTDLCASIAGPDCIRMKFDSGLPAKRNAIVDACQKPLLLLACDDFDFSTPEARQGIEKMVKVLDENPDVDVAGGHVDGLSYEGYLEYVPGEYVRETRLVPDGTPFQRCDLTVNYFLARTDKIVAWDVRMKIGGEHFDWFWQMRQAGCKIVWVSGVNVNTLQLGTSTNVQDPRYGGFRRRAINLGHPLMKKQYNIKDYISFDGGIS